MRCIDDFDHRVAGCAQGLSKHSRSVWQRRTWRVNEIEKSIVLRAKSLFLWNSFTTGVWVACKVEYKTTHLPSSWSIFTSRCMWPTRRLQPSECYRKFNLKLHTHTLSSVFTPCCVEFVRCVPPIARSDSRDGSRDWYGNGRRGHDASIKRTHEHKMYFLWNRFAHAVWALRRVRPLFGAGGVRPSSRSIWQWRTRTTST